MIRTPVAACPFAPGTPLVTYLRHSPGEDQTITSQENAVREWFTRYQLILTRVFKDEARTGTRVAGRDQFLAMVDALRDGTLTPRPAGVVFWSYSRFAREWDDSQFYLADLRRHGYAIYSLSEPVPDDNIGRLTEAMHIFQAAEQSRKISADAKRGLHDLAKRGFAIGGFPPRGFRKSAPVVIGYKKNGTPHVAHKWEMDPECEAQVRQAWKMKLDGATTWDIHKATHLFGSINSYTTFFRNRGYAGDLKCGDLLVPDAHPAYVSREEFERVQQQRRPTRGNPKSPNGDPNHSRRRASPYLLSGILFCECGAAMIGDHDGSTEFYRCGRQQRQGRSACAASRIVAWYLHKFICDWLADHVMTLNYLLSVRDEINAQLSGDRGELAARLARLERDLDQVDQRVRRLMDAIERTGISSEIEQRLRERQAEARQISAEMDQVKAQLNQQRVEISNAGLAVVAQHMREQLLAGSAEDVRAIVRQSLVRADLADEELALTYIPPVVEIPQAVITGFRMVPPREPSLKPRLPFPLQFQRITFPRPAIGRASPMYGASRL